MVIESITSVCSPEHSGHAATNSGKMAQLGSHNCSEVNSAKKSARASALKGFTAPLT